MKSPRHGPLEPPTVSRSHRPIALSLEKTMSVLSAIPASSTQSTICPTR